MRTSEKNLPFSPGSIIIIPPGIEHGSVSEQGFRNISICGDFDRLLHVQNPVTLSDNQHNEGTLLATLIYQNRFGNSDYLSKLCSAYIHFLLQNLNVEDQLSIAVNQIISELTSNFYDESLKPGALLQKSGYAEDYIRAQFKKMTGKTPNAFLTDIRIRHACFLIDLYRSTLSLQEIAERCGYTDYVYFSKKFKEVTGVSPRDYKKTL